jgi:hypothetical protein
MAPRHEIPTHLNVEDRAFLGLSVRQVMHLTVGAATAYAIWNQWLWAPPALRFGVAGLCLLVAIALALVRPGGRALEEWAFVAFHHAATPKRATWRTREPRIDEWRARGAEWAELQPRVAWREADR